VRNDSPATPLAIRIAEPILGEEEIEAVASVLRSGRLAQGAEVAAFENEFSQLIQGRACVAVSSGTAALHLSLLALGIGPGDEVIIPSFTFPATANAVHLCGAKPVFADVLAADYCLDADSVRASIGPKTAAVIVVHLYGQTADLKPLMSLCNSRGLALIEDACQAHGALYEGEPAGTFGSAAAFSFYATKNMTTGEGGMVVLGDDEVAHRVRLLRNHGISAPDTQELIGMNMRMAEMAAAMGRVQLRRLPDSIKRRSQNAHRYSSLLAGVVVPPDIPGRTPAWNLYTIRVVEDRDLVLRRLNDVGVESRVYYRTPIHRLKPFEILASLPMTDLLSREVLSLPVHPRVTGRDVETVVKLLHEALP
jgi:dTDP-4-amino-4,6-dideoxygalactose transaminase